MARHREAEWAAAKREVFGNAGTDAAGPPVARTSNPLHSPGAGESHVQLLRRTWPPQFCMHKVFGNAGTDAAGPPIACTSHLLHSPGAGNPRVQPLRRTCPPQ